MTTPDAILEKVCRAIDILVKAGEPYGGLFPSVLDLRTHEMLMEQPLAIEGQRTPDRARRGSNLIHDQTVLHTMYGLSSALDRREFAEAADRYLKRFATHCTDTVTGLFPWGEHAFWILDEDRPGSGHFLSNPAWKRGAVHDHLRQAPVWLWEKLHAFDPPCVERFAEGLDRHYQDDERSEFIRHALIERFERFGRGDRSADFPRHGGFYILDWSFAYVKSGRSEFLGQVEHMLSYHWPHRDENGLLPVHTRPDRGNPIHDGVDIPSQTVSLATSLLESAELLEDAAPDVAGRMRERAAVYVGGFLSAPHDLDRDVYVYTCRRGTGEIISTVHAYGSVYGHWPAAYVALICLCAHRIRPDEGLFRWAEAVGRLCLVEPFPDDVTVPAMDAGLAVELLADLYDLTGEAVWLDGGLGLAERLMGIYLDGDLPRGAAGVDWYESQMQPGDLLHGLARLALLAMGREDCPLGPNYVAK